MKIGFGEHSEKNSINRVQDLEGWAIGKSLHHSMKRAMVIDITTLSVAEINMEARCE